VGLPLELVTLDGVIDLAVLFQKNKKLVQWGNGARELLRTPRAKPGASNRPSAQP